LYDFVGLLKKDLFQNDFVYRNEAIVTRGKSVIFKELAPTTCRGYSMKQSI